MTKVVELRGAKVTGITLQILTQVLILKMIVQKVFRNEGAYLNMVMAVLISNIVLNALFSYYILIGNPGQALQSKQLGRCNLRMA